MKHLLKVMGSHGAPIRLFLWAALWLNLNTGPWLVRQSEGPWVWLIFLQVYAPAGILMADLLLSRRSKSMSTFQSPTMLLMCYGVVAALAGVFSPAPGGLHTGQLRIWRLLAQRASSSITSGPLICQASFSGGHGSQRWWLR